MYSVILSVESVTLHEKWELVSVDNNTKQIIFCEKASTLSMKSYKHYAQNSTN